MFTRIRFRCSRVVGSGMEFVANQAIKLENESVRRFADINIQASVFSRTFSIFFSHCRAIIYIEKISFQLCFFVCPSILRGNFMISMVLTLTIFGL